VDTLADHQKEVRIMNKIVALAACLVAVIFLLVSNARIGAQTDHQQHQAHMAMMHGDVPLTQVGESAFAAIQEAIHALEADPDTDWTKVDMEGLRQHLIDMNHMTFDVDVLKKENVDNGVAVEIKATSPAAAQTLQRVFSMHPTHLKMETGWTMDVQDQGSGQYRLVTTTPKPEEVAKIRGLGYIGLMAYGSHHLPHHWMIVRGTSPH
jgi:hypothetical protein